MRCTGGHRLTRDSDSEGATSQGAERKVPRLPSRARARRPDEGARRTAEALRTSDEARREKRLQTFLTCNADRTSVTLKWGDNHAGQSRKTITALADRRPDLKLFWTPGKCTGSALLHLITELNRKLAEMVAPCVLLNHNRELEGHLRPRHLLGALWFQLCQAELSLRACRRCGK